MEHQEKEIGNGLLHMIWPEMIEILLLISSYF